MMLMPILMLLATTVNLPPGCHMVAEDSNMLGGVRVGAASLGACCRACDGSCQQWTWANATCRVNVTGRAVYSPGDSFGAPPLVSIYISDNLHVCAGTVPQPRTCTEVLGGLCAAARRSSAGDCLVCAGLHQRQLMLANCSTRELDSYCSSQ